MEQSSIDRINVLAQKARTPAGLTAAEAAERAALRQAYVAAFRESLVAQLEGTVIQSPDGTRRPLGRKESEAPRREKP